MWHLLHYASLLGITQAFEIQTRKREQHRPNSSTMTGSSTYFPLLQNLQSVCCLTTVLHHSKTVVDAFIKALKRKENTMRTLRETCWFKCDKSQSRFSVFSPRKWVLSFKMIFPHLGNSLALLNVIESNLRKNTWVVETEILGSMKNYSNFISHWSNSRNIDIHGNVHNWCRGKHAYFTIH